MIISRELDSVIKILMSDVEFNKLQDILKCESHRDICAWYHDAVLIRQQITFAFGENEVSEKSEHK